MSTTREGGSGRRADVVQLAGELFAQKGYRATTVREIADAAGILYHHFDSAPVVVVRAVAADEQHAVDRAGAAQPALPAPAMT